MVKINEKIKKLQYSVDLLIKRGVTPKGIRKELRPVCSQKALPTKKVILPDYKDFHY